MAVIRGSKGSFIGVPLLFAVAACGPTPPSTVPVSADNHAAITIAVAPTPQPSTALLWGRVPYCNCFAGSATVNVANALKEAKLTVNLQELSPRDGWLYFAITFDPATATGEQVRDAMMAGGAELLNGPP
ncbi:MAG: hypothetical protein ACOYNY_31415 [Caldilineaceae bacterium]